MGIYINPRNDTDARSKRETILKLAGKRVSMQDFITHKPGSGNIFGVAICDNGFIAAGVAYKPGEAEAFVRAYGSRAEYCFLTKDQIASLDPTAAAAL